MGKHPSLNCLSNHNAASCLLPIKGGGIHLWQEGSRNAVKEVFVAKNTYDSNSRNHSYGPQCGARTADKMPTDITVDQAGLIALLLLPP